MFDNLHLITLMALASGFAGSPFSLATWLDGMTIPSGSTQMMEIFSTKLPKKKRQFHWDPPHPRIETVWAWA
jgi:hypothetical protein